MKRRNEVRDRRIEDPSDPPLKYRGGKVVGRINRRWMNGSFGRRDYDYPPAVDAGQRKGDES